MKERENATPLLSPGTKDEIRLHHLWAILVRNRWLILGVTLLALLAGAVFTTLQEKTFRSAATLRMEERASDLSLLGRFAPAGLAPIAGLAGSDIQTDMGVLRSRQVAEAVVDSLALHIQLLEPDTTRSAVLRILRAPRDVEPAVYELQLRRDGSYVVRAQDSAARRASFAPVQIGRPVQIGGVELALEPVLRSAPPERIRLAVRRFDDAVAGVRKELRIIRPDPGAQLLDVEYRSPDPEIAAAVPNAITASFIAYKTAVAKNRSRSTVDFLREQVATGEQALREAETKLQKFRERAQIVSPEEQASQQVRRFAELQARRDELEANRTLLRQLFVRLQENPAGEASSSVYRQLASFPAFLTNAGVQDILRSLIQLENERAALLVRRTPKSVDVEGINRRIQELELQLYQLARNHLSNLDNQIATLDAGLGDFAGQLGQVPAREVELLRLVREQKLLEEVYTLLQTRLKEEEIRLMDQPAEVQLIDTALVPQVPSSPKPLLNLGLALIFGLAAGVGAAVVRDSLDTRVRSPEDVTEATLGMPVLGLIPHVPFPATANGNDRKHLRTLRLPFSRAPISNLLVTRVEPRNPASEAYRNLRTNLTVGGSGRRPPQVLVVSSAMPEEGKTTSTANLAVTLAQQGIRTLLMDADVRNGTLHQLFDVSQEPGLSGIARGSVSLQDAVREIQIEGGIPLSLLPCGAYPEHPAELLGSARVRELVEACRNLFEVVLLDAPPVNVATDAALLGTLADATLLVARHGVTEKQALHRAAVRLRQLEIPVEGVVLNGVNPDNDLLWYYGAGARSHAGRNGKNSPTV